MSKQSVWDCCPWSLWVIWLHWALNPQPSLCSSTCVREEVGGGRKRKAQRFKCWPFVPSGQIYIYVARVQSGGNNTFECSAEWATIAVVCKQCGPGSDSGHRTQLPRLQAPALRLWQTWHSHRFNETQRGSKHFMINEQFNHEVIVSVLDSKECFMNES